MRELEFRAWDGKKMIDDVIPASETSIIELFEYEWQETEVKAVEQYTGLKDKNDKEIYEGDIVEALIDGVWNTGTNTVSFGKAIWKLEVVYDNVRFMDVFKIIGSKSNPDRIYYLFDKELSEIKVIGNIHENPELMKEEE